MNRIEAVLFRSTPEELEAIANFRNRPEDFRKWAEKLSETELRWQIICRRFIDEDELIITQVKDIEDNENS